RHLCRPNRSALHQLHPSHRHCQPRPAPRRRHRSQDPAATRHRLRPLAGLLCHQQSAHTKRPHLSSQSRLHPGRRGRTRLSHSHRPAHRHRCHPCHRNRPRQGHPSSHVRRHSPARRHGARCQHTHHHCSHRQPRRQSTRRQRKPPPPEPLGRHRNHG